MFQMRLLPDQPLIKFDRHLPVFNWGYPFDRDEDQIEDRLAPYLVPAKRRVARRAIYIHIPFCETICTFCPFRRDKYRSESEVEQYLGRISRGDGT